jgi:hypothetical protein
MKHFLAKLRRVLATPANKPHACRRTSPPRARSSLLLEALEDRLAPATVTGTGDNDTLILRQVAGDPAHEEYSLNGAAFVQVSSADPFTFNAGDNEDLLWVDTSN